MITNNMYIGLFIVGFMHMALVGISHHRGTFYFIVFKDKSSGHKILLKTDL